MTWEDIPGWFDFGILYSQAVNHLPTPGVLVECGCHLGRSLCYLAHRVKESKRDFQVYGVELTVTDELVDNLFDCGFNDLVTLVPADSVKASSLFADNSVSMVFLDTDHSYEHLRAEIVAWLPKVKIGGIIAGDDIGLPHELDPIWPGVRRAVTELFGTDWQHSPHDSWVHFKRK
jgi:cephalosporin hydroxylase